MSEFAQDLKYAVRALRRSPGFALVVVLALALGIGANTAIFSIVNGTLLQPLPYPQPDHLLALFGRFTGIGIPKDQNAFSAPELMDLKRLNTSLSHVAAIQQTSANVNVTGVPERLDGALVSPELFPMLGVQPRLGRVFRAEEGIEGRDQVALISEGLWKRRFGSDPGVIGRKVLLNDLSFEIVGVLPSDFAFPADTTEVWGPLSFSAAALSPNNRGSHGLQVIARVKPELTLAQAHTDLDRVSRTIIEQNKQYPYQRFNYTLIANPLLEETVNDIKPALLILLGAVGFVLLIACANIANLLLVRASGREREMAIRTALGAGRRRLVRQMLTESLLLGLLGGIAGLVLARVGLRTLIAVAESSFPRVATVTLDWRVLTFTFVISLVTGLLFGLAPAWHAAHVVTHESLKEGTRSATAGSASARVRRVLIVSEIALSLVLLAGAGLLIKSFIRLQEVDPGFRPDNVLTMRITLAGQRYAKPQQVSSFYRDLLARVRTLPGVEAAGAISALPLSGLGGSGTTTVDSNAVPMDKRTPELDQRPAMPGYFEAMGIGLVKGRLFDERDTETSAPVAIVDDTLVHTFWPNEDPLGKRLHLGGTGSHAPWMTVVGVVRHVRMRTLEAPSRMEVYWPEVQRPFNSLSLAMRTSTEPMSLANAVQKQVLAVDPEQPVYRIRSMNEYLASSIERRRLSMLLLAIFAGAALALAAVGIYGITSYSVAQRSQEMGVRMALGASRGGILRLVLGQSLTLAAVGVVAGLFGAFILSALLSTMFTSMLFNTTAIDPLTFILVAAILIAVTVLASYVPARRATHVDPMVALRYE
jgi:putative ABC transport system permease protein